MSRDKSTAIKQRWKKFVENWAIPSGKCLIVGTMLLPKAVGAILPVMFAASLAVGCSSNNSDGDEVTNLAEVTVDPDGPKLASIDKSTSIFERPSLDAPVVGTMRAGTMVARSSDPVSKSGCAGGWYAIHPRGFVCAGQGAPTNLAHPTLAVMKTLPARQAPLPYQYFSTTKPTSLYEWDRAKGAAVREVGKLRRRSRVAVVGSWTAQNPEGATENLAMLPDGRYVNAAHLEDNTVSSLKGVVLDEENKLPVAFVVKQGIRAWSLDGAKPARVEGIEPHSIVPLTGRYRTVGDTQFWGTKDGNHVRHADVTVVRRRETFPEFVGPEQKWIDVSVIMGTVVLYEGRKPVYVALCSVGVDRTGNPETDPTTQMGTFEITAKHITSSEPGTKRFADDHDVFDVPWVQKLSSGQMIHGAIWHSRFGVEHGPGNIQLSANDAAYVFSWAEPVVPEGWHSVLRVVEGESKVIVVVRK
ncbi:MAG: L,D-transpeptidase [Polyangiaceae bacterium]|nr:L,D-transpeptidase [Polyangiaceae bacterium]